MSRFTTALSIGLALAIVLAAGMVGWRITSFAPTQPELDYADPAVGTAFYAALNAVLSGANHGALDEVVTWDFVDHSDGSTADDLTGRLTAFGASFPGTQLEVLGIDPSANSLVVSLAPVSLDPVTVGGLTLSTQPFDGGYDVLRIRNGKVAERWSNGVPALSATTFAGASLATRGSASMAIRLDRTELPVGAELSWEPGRSNVLMVETGAITVRQDWNQGQELQHEVVTIRAGDAFPIPSNMKVRIEPAVSEPASVLIFATWKVQPTDVPAPIHSRGAASKLLWVSNLPVPPAAGWTVAFGNVSIPQYVNVTLNGGAAMEVLLCTDASAMQVVTGDGSIESLHADLTSIDRSSSATLDDGSAAHVTGATSIELQATADTPGLLWLISISPTNAVATPTV